MTAENVGSQFDRLPATDEERIVPDRPTREEVIAFFETRYGIASVYFAATTFWEKGSGKIWAFRGEVPSPIDVEALGIHLLRTDQHDWKPTTDAMQRYGRFAERNVIHLTREEAARFWRGETQPFETDDASGYVIVTQPMPGGPEPLGVGLALRGELRSQVSKGRRRDL